MSARKVYSPELKARAVADVASGKRKSDVAKALGISSGMLSNWLKGNGKSTLPTKPTKPTNVDGARMALVHLRKAKLALFGGIRNGTIEDLDSSHLLMLLALRSLQDGNA